MKLIYAIRCSFWRLLRFHFLKLWRCNLCCQSFIEPKYLVCHGSQREALTPFRLSCDDGPLQNFEDEFLFVILPCHIKMTTQFHKLSSLQHFGIGVRLISLRIIFSSSGTLISLISIFGKTDWNTALYNHEIAHKHVDAHVHTHTGKCCRPMLSDTDLPFSVFWRMSRFSSALWEANQTCRAKVATPGLTNLPKQIHLKIR